MRAPCKPRYQVEMEPGDPHVLRLSGCCRVLSSSSALKASEAQGEKEATSCTTTRVRQTPSSVCTDLSTCNYASENCRQRAVPARVGTVASHVFLFRSALARTNAFIHSSRHCSSKRYYAVRCDLKWFQVVSHAIKRHQAISSGAQRYQASFGVCAERDGPWLPSSRQS